jgi:predicted tellurium resistance membrane protein TerC
VPKGYIYAAMAFSAVVEGLNMASRNSQAKKAALTAARQAELNQRETAEPGV